MADNSAIAKSFLSHSSRDKPAVEVIKGLLERGERPIPCWFDKDDLRSKGTWMSQLEDAVAACGSAVVFYGPDGKGPVHKYEIDLLLKRAMYTQGREGLRLVVVLLPGAQENAVQGFISLHMWADFRKGLDDAAALQRLRAFILGEAPGPGLGDDPKIPKPAIEPYRGLETFEGKHAAYFFGRDEDIKKLCGHLHEWPLTAVIGGSGSGKSSLVRAGLQTELAREERSALAHTTIITLRPGPNPIWSLAEQIVASLPEPSTTERVDLVKKFDGEFRTHPEKLLNRLTSLYPRDDQQILLFVDQLEELFTHSAESRPVETSSGVSQPSSASTESSQAQFVDLLAAVAKSQLDRLRIVATLRSDFLGHCLSMPALKSLIEDRMLLLGNLSDEALRAVIEVPAFKVGAYFEKGLVARILKDVANQNGSLPLLQHALKELWEKRRFGFLTDDGYDDTGGVEGALNKRADAVLRNMKEDQRKIAENIFLRLTTLGEGVSDTRRRVHRSELYPQKIESRVIDDVLQVLSSKNNRLIVINHDGTVEVTHEALIQRWDTLKTLLKNNRETKRLQDRLRVAANEWADPQHNRDPSYLWEGSRLDVVRKFRQTQRNNLTALERSFLGASVAKQLETKREKRSQQKALLNAETERAQLAEKNAAQARENAEKQERLKKSAYRIAQMAAIATVIALIAALIAGLQTWRALEQQADASRDNANFYWRFAVNARDAGEPLKAAHLFLRGASSLEKIILDQPKDAQSIRSKGLAAQALDKAIIRSWFEMHSLQGARFSRDGLRLLTWGHHKTAKLWDITKPTPIRTFEHNSSIEGAKFNHDESHVLTWSNDGLVRLWDVAKNESIQTFDHGADVDTAEFSPDTSRVLTVSNDGIVKLWEMDKPEPIKVLQYNARVEGVQITPNASYVLTVNEDGIVKLWDIAKPDAIQTFIHKDFALSAELSPDASRVLTTSNGGVVRLWDVSHPEPIQRFQQSSNVTFMHVNTDASLALTWSDNGILNLWSISQSEPIRTFECKFKSRFGGLQFNRDASRVLAWSEKGEAKLWHVNKYVPIYSFPEIGDIAGAQFNDESRLLTWSWRQGSHRLWDVSKIEPVRTFELIQKAEGAQFSQDESRVLTWADGEIAKLWDVNKLEAIRSFPHEAILEGAQFNHDSSGVLTWSRDGVAKLWDVSILEPIQTFHHGICVNGAEFSPDEARVLTRSGSLVNNEGKLRLWDVKQPFPIQIFNQSAFVRGAKFSRDGSRVLSWGRDHKAKLWDIAKQDAIQVFEHGADVFGARFTCDESQVLTWSGGGSAKLWDCTTSKLIGTFEHKDSVDGAIFNRDESRVLTWSSDGTAKLWDLTNFKLIQSFQHGDVVNGALFNQAESRVLTWSGDWTAKLWDLNRHELLQTFQHDDVVSKALFLGDESQLLTCTGHPISGGGDVSLWDATKADPIHIFKHDGSVYGQQLSRDESRVLTWSDDGTVRLWDTTDPLEVLTPAERILELEVRSGTTLDDQQNLRTLKFDKWQTKAKSPEYQAIEKKLATRSAGKSH